MKRIGGLVLALVAIFAAVWMAGGFAPSKTPHTIDSDAATYDLKVYASGPTSMFVISDPNATVLIDAGDEESADSVLAFIAAQDWGERPITCAVLTHGHNDHARMAADLQARGIKIVAGKGDLADLQAGFTNAAPTGWVGSVVKRYDLVPAHFPAVTPDILLTDDTNLQDSCGLPIYALMRPGHSPGSVVYRLGDHAFVGDQLIGGYMSALWRGVPRPHFFMDDTPANMDNIKTVSSSGAKFIHVAHGGPTLTAEAVAEFHTSHTPD